MSKLKQWLAANTAAARLTRTIAQGIVGVLIANVDLIVGSVALIPLEMRPVIVALVMAVLSPIMAALGGEQQ